MTALMWLGYVLPVLAIIGGLTWVTRTPRLGAAAKNQVATGLAAALFVLLATAAVLVAKTDSSAGGQPSHPLLNPGLACAGAAFAGLSGWAVCVLWLGWRHWRQQRFGLPGCTTIWQLTMAWLVLLGLIVVYTEVINLLEQRLLEKQRRERQTPQNGTPTAPIESTPAPAPAPASEKTPGPGGAPEPGG